jgi:hypothetical protein
VLVLNDKWNVFEDPVGSDGYNSIFTGLGLVLGGVADVNIYMLFDVGGVIELPFTFIAAKVSE